jgi:hypothetical protein
MISDDDRESVIAEIVRPPIGPRTVTYVGSCRAGLHGSFDYKRSFFVADAEGISLSSCSFPARGVRFYLLKCEAPSTVGGEEFSLTDAESGGELFGSEPE